VKLAADGAPLEPGTVHVAPDNVHLGVTRDRRLLLSSEPPVAGFRPSASFLFDSAGRAAGSALVAVILTGMGTDGADGLAVARAAGAYVIAQDEASSVVFGMAQEAVRRGVTDAILPLEQIGPRLSELVIREAHVQ
jgi:two-component system, chemotaxis family, protein-glutamate methylesterase/glutaminase